MNALSTIDPMDVARFWSSVAVGRLNECWMWKGCVSESGHGVFKLCGTNVTAHRAAFTIATGNPPASDAVVRHKCDNPGCCNPQHLESGTHADNVMDRVIRDRSARGEQNGRSKLTKDAVREIRASGGPVYLLALRYGVSQYTIYAVLERRTWKHVA